MADVEEQYIYLKQDLIWIILQCSVVRSGHSVLNDKYKCYVTLCLDLRNSCNGRTAPFSVVTLLTTVFSLEEPIICIL